MKFEDFDLRKYVRYRYDKHNVTNPSELTACVYLQGVSDIRFYELRSKIEDELKKYTSELGAIRKASTND